MSVLREGSETWLQRMLQGVSRRNAYRRSTTHELRVLRDAPTVWLPVPRACNLR